MLRPGGRANASSVSPPGEQYRGERASFPSWQPVPRCRMLLLLRATQHSWLEHQIRQILQGQYEQQAAPHEAALVRMEARLRLIDCHVLLVPGTFRRDQLTIIVSSQPVVRRRWRMRNIARQERKCSK